MTTAERRAAPRVAANFPVRYFYQPFGASPAKTLDVSLTGARVQAFDPLPAGASIAFLMFTDAQSVLDVRGQIVRVEPMPPEDTAPFRVSVRFTKLSDADRHALERAIDRLKKL